MYEFIFKSYRDMTPEDYQKVGFKSGLEIHQQLLTEKKLFCRCPAGHYSKDFDAEILRHMRPTLSEMGVYDGTALMEFKTKKDIIYRINRNTVCTYEMDDTPPFLMNEDALDIALEIGMLFNCVIVDELHIARKQYLDGSIPTGFQRTAIYGLDGWIPYKDKKVKIVQMSIEEDSCREVSDIGHQRFYKTDRLGMPLIETVTEPAMKTPSEVAEVAWILSNTVRSTHKVRRGIGAAREDVNVSVTGGTRIEIKGVSKISLIPLLTYNEAMRQWNLLRLKEELKKRGITEESFKAESFDITKIVRKPSYAPLKNAVEKGYRIKSVVLKGFAGLLRWQTQTDTYFSKEISDRVRVIACLTSIPNIIHSDSKGDNIPSADWTAIKKISNASDNDSVLIVWGSEEDSNTAVKEIIIRAKEAIIGVPSETRQALSDGTNGFERILPGADRMYPDTDLPPMRIIQDRLDRIKNWIPEQFWVRQIWYKELGIPADLISELCISKYASLFKQAVKEWKINPTAASVFLIQYPKRLKKKGYNIGVLNEDIYTKVLKAFSDGKIPHDAVLTILERIIERGQFTDDMIPVHADQDEVTDVIRNSNEEIKNIPLNDELNKEAILMGSIMSKLKGKVPASVVAEMVGFRKRGSAMPDNIDYKGYRGKALDVLKRFNAFIWSDVEVITNDGSFKGLVLPRSETADEYHVVLKIPVGYNIGIASDKIKDVKINGRREANYKIPEKAFPYDYRKPRVKLLGTGGTIASRLDYKTGAVIPAFSPGELYGSVPELADYCNLETEKLYGVFSENMAPENWIGLAEAIGKEIKKGVQGIVIGHGTDTMHHTSAILSFMVQNSPVPIVMVGSQRSSDRPSSDAALNLIHSVKTAAESDIAEIMVCMFGPTSDIYGLLHRGTRVRKMHSSYRSTFRTISDIPIATVSREKITPLRQDYKRRRQDNNVIINAVFEEKVSIVYYYPNMHPDIIDSLIQNGYKGIIIAGTGLGHVNKPLYPALDRARQAGVAVYMTVQTLWGYVQMYVYETGRVMMDLGVIPAANMLPEVAYVKLGWALGQTNDLEKVKEIMLTPIAGEITEREPSNGYLIYQGGLPEVEEFIKMNRK